MSENGFDMLGDTLTAMTTNDIVEPATSALDSPSSTKLRSVSSCAETYTAPCIVMLLWSSHAHTLLDSKVKLKR